MIVLDASALLDAILTTDRSAAVLRHLEDPAVSLIAPDHMLVETTRTLRRHSLAGLIPSDRADREAANAIGLAVRTYPSLDLLPRAWQLRSSITIDDALYLALAEAMPGARLLTTDRKLAKAASGRIDVIAL